MALELSLLWFQRWKLFHTTMVKMLEDEKKGEKYEEDDCREIQYSKEEEKKEEEKKRELMQCLKVTEWGKRSRR